MKAKNREGFFAFLQGLVLNGRIKVATKIPLHSKLVVTTVEDFNPKNNTLWQNQANKSYPRDGMVCCNCKKPVVMSDGMFAMYSEDPHPENVVCGKCAFNI